MVSRRQFARESTASGLNWGVEQPGYSSRGGFPFCGGALGCGGIIGHGMSYGGRGGGGSSAWVPE